jgi:hypothetical protein
LISRALSPHVLCHHVEQHIAVDQKGHGSIAAGKRHYRVGAHCHIAAAAQMRDEAGTSSLSAAGPNPNYPHSLPVEFECDLGMWQQACAFANIHRNCDLPLGRDPHRWFLTLTCKSKGVALESKAARRQSAVPAALQITKEERQCQ